ncbi:MAG: class I SAM-dependent methyltransferase [Dermatophilaceae bacterium]
MNREHAAAMAQTYVTSRFARIVDAGGALGLMNLGWSPDPVHSPGTAAQRQIWLAERLITRLDPAPGAVILDLGCGKGGLSRLLAGIGEIRILGVNLDLLQLRAAADGKGSGNLGYVTAAAERLPLTDGSVDGLMIVELLTHVREKYALWDEVVRVLRPGGRLVIAAITLARPLPGLGLAAREQADRLAGYFAERAQDVPLAADVVGALRRRGVQARDEDLTDGVFGPRHEEMLGVLRSLTSADDAVRHRARSQARQKWNADPETLKAYLHDCVSFHPMRLYEYHLFWGERA